MLIISPSIGLNDFTDFFRLCSGAKENGSGRLSCVKSIFGMYISSLSHFSIGCKSDIFIFATLSLSKSYCDVAGVVKFFQGQLLMSSHHLAWAP